MTADRLTIFDTTLRDGEQAPGFSMRIDEKLRMARQLAALGVDIIEAGFPIASDADAEAVRDDLDPHHRAGHRRAGAVQPRRHRTRRLGAASPPSAKRIHVFIATSDLHLERKLRMSRDALSRRSRWTPSGTRARTPTTCSSRRRMRPAATRTSSAASSRRSFSRAPRRSICRTPSATRRPTKSSRSSAGLIGRVPSSDQAIFSTHCHDDLGLAVANTLAALTGGARQVECTDQRHRRARRQRVARRSRDGDAACAPIACRSRPGSTPSRSSPPASC